MRVRGDLDWFLVRMTLRAYGWALAVGVVFALLVGVPIVVFHVPARVVAGLMASLFR
jgi:hypothetical protein